MCIYGAFCHTMQNMSHKVGKVIFLVSEGVIDTEMVICRSRTKSSQKFQFFRFMKAALTVTYN